MNQYAKKKRSERIAGGPGSPEQLAGPLPEMKQVSLQVELLTKQFGGGSVARKADPDRWLRSTSVRGALRFWWRALYGAQHNTVQEMWQEERLLFGTAATSNGGPGLVSVVVNSVAPQEFRDFSPANGHMSSVAYFPALELGTGQVAELVQPGIRCTITLSVAQGCADEQWKQLKDALIAYVSFGGSGARTRRSAGALGWVNEQEARDLGIPLTLKEWKTWWSELPRGGANHNIFSLHDRVVFAAKPARNAEDAQNQVLDLWREVRQWRRHPNSWWGQGPWGRSEWPEADAIRHIFGQHSAYHEPRHDNLGKAPRAHLGLPLIIKFKGHGDPDKAELVLSHERGKDRYASPVITAVARIDGGFVGMVLATKSRLRGTIALKNQNQTLNVGSPEQVYARIRTILAKKTFETIAGEET